MLVDFRNRARTTALFRHECAHLIVARSLGFDTSDIVLSADRGGAGIDLQPSISSLDDAANYLQARLKVLYAGAIAEALQNKQVQSEATKKLLETTASDDFSKIRESMRLLVGISHPNASRDEFQQRLNEAVETLSDASVEIVLANVNLIIDMAVFCMRKLDEATAANDGVPPSELRIAAADIDEFLRDK
jgi:hypothetical protein